MKMHNTFDEELFVDKFVGRGDLLAKVDRAIADAPNRHVIMFVGKGGIGKTALLRKIHTKYRNNSNLIIVRIDYGQARSQSLPTLVDGFTRQIVDQEGISKNDLDEFRKKLTVVEKAFAETKDEEAIQLLETDAYLFLINKFNENLNKRRLLILSDSAEIGDLKQGIRINEFASEFKNAVIIVAGRPTTIVLNRFTEEYVEVYSPKGWQVHKHITLKKFTVDDAIEYFTRILPTPLESDLVEKIVILTDGKPVLLAITAEWLKYNVQLPDEINKSKKELESLDKFHLKQLRKYYERTLVERIRAVRKPLDQAILYLSFLDRRYDEQILRLAMNHFPSKDIEHLEPKLRKMAFVRSFLDDSSGLLHDEAKRLINQYAWPPHDPDGEERRALARKVIEGFYLPEIESLHRAAAEAIKSGDGAQLSAYYSSEEDYLAYQLEMECIDYHFRISLDEGRRYVTQLIQEGLTLSKREGIRHEVTTRIGEAEEEVTAARMNISRGQFEGSREILEQTLEQEGLSPWYRITLLSELSNAPTAPKEKAAYLMQAMEIAEQTQSQEDVAKLSNALGLMYRSQGLWREAEDAYQKTLAILKRVDDPDQKAGTLNNMAYVKLLQGELDLAESLADIALGIRQARGNQLGLAFSYLTRGEITEAKGNREQAMRAYQTAANLFEKLGRDQHHAEALLHLSEARRIEGDFESAEKLLSPGLAQPLSEIRARAERELGALYLAQGTRLADPEEKASKYRAAVAAFRQSLETSEQKRDWYGQAQAFFDLIFVGFIIDSSVNDDYAAQLKALLAEHDYPILKVRLDEIYADLVYERGEVIPAFRQYIEVARLLSTHHIQKYNAMFDRFKGKFLAQPGNVQQEMCVYFDEAIAELPQESRLRSALSNLCRAIKIAY